jgi:hypothetical protein
VHLKYVCNHAPLLMFCPCKCLYPCII